MLANAATAAQGHKARRKNMRRRWLYTRGTRLRLWLVGLSMVSSCAGSVPRIALGPGEVAYAEARRDGLAKLRVYPSTSLLLLYPSKRATRASFPDKGPQSSAPAGDLELFVSSKTPGQIIFEDLHHGQRRFWVTFDPRCRRHACSFGFVLTERKRYELSNLPQRAGYGPPALYHKRLERGRQMQQGRFARLVEANDVWIYRSSAGRETVQLQTRRSHDHKVRQSERSRGIQ